MSETRPSESELSTKDKEWLKHIVSGTVRNILANEFGLNRNLIGKDNVRKIVADHAGAIISDTAKSVSRESTFQKRIEVAVIKTAQEEVRATVRKLIEERVEEAISRVHFNISLSEETPPTIQQF